MPAKPKCPKCGGHVGSGGVNNPGGRAGGKTGTQRWKCSSCGWHGTRPIGVEAAASDGIDKKRVAKLHKKLKGDKRNVKRYVITAAQNATPVHRRFFDSLLGYCKHNRAQLIVIPYRYRNPTAWSTPKQGDDWWATELVPYLLDRRIELNKNLVVLADIKTQPTANSPLEGFETITAGQSAVVGHPKLELTTVATPHQKLPKILTTTGAVTERNYIPSKAGKKGEHHHTFGACVVEVDGPIFHLRQINAVRDGSFMDLQCEYTSTGVSGGHRAAGLVLGDEHVEFIDPDVVQATYERPDSMVNSLRPEFLVHHDVHDFYSQNHHDRDKVFVRLVKHQTGMADVEAGLEQTARFIDEHTYKDATHIFVPSNHPNEHLERWMNETDWRKDPTNASFYLRTALAMVEAAHMTNAGAKTIDPFTHWMKKKIKSVDQCKFLNFDESFRINGIEIGYHGHQGPNGSRGTRAAYGKVGVKTVIGHSHSPGIKDGVYQTGTSSRLRLAYNHGPSSWLNTHCLIYPNGKRTLINIVEGKWRA